MASLWFALPTSLHGGEIGDIDSLFFANMATDPSSAEWQSICSRVCALMIEEIKGFTTPISRVVEHDYGELEGSGSYVEIDGGKFLVTNEHVAARRSTHSLAHQFGGCSDVYRTMHPFVCITYPHDVALCSIDESVWKRSSHQARAIPFGRFAKQHSPVQRELLFLAGYAGETSKFLFGQLNAVGHPYLMQETEMPASHGDPRFHFAIFYPPDKATPIDGTSGTHLPCPPGLSGTLVWNTRYAETTLSGKDWSPSLAQVTGIIWGWPSSDACLLATKAEFLDLAALKQAIDQL